MLSARHVQNPVWGKILIGGIFRMEVEAEFCVFINILDILARAQEEKGLHDPG